MQWLKLTHGTSQLMDFFRKNNDYFGFAIALGCSMAVFGLLYVINNILLKRLVGHPFLEDSFMYIIALGINVLPINYYQKFQAYKTVRGMMVFVFMGAGYIIYMFFGEELGIRKAKPQQFMVEVRSQASAPQAYQTL